MSNYEVIAKKYRPKRFSDVCEQKAIVTTLKNAIIHNRLAHAYLFCGLRGTGKTTLARIFAKAINCHNLIDGEPCNDCPSCQEIASGHSLDVLEIDGASNRGIDDIRQINETVGYAPSSGDYKIYIIDEVHMLTKEAFNALLKTLEEPPPKVKFFFATTEPHKVLPTIISRCQRFDLERIGSDKIVGKLTFIANDLGVEVEKEALVLIAKLSEGSMRDAESLLDQVICLSEPPITLDTLSRSLGLVSNDIFLKLDEAISTKNLPFAFELAEELFNSGIHLGHFLESMADHYRNHLKNPKSPLSKEQSFAICDYLLGWLSEINKTPFKRIHLEMVLLHIIKSANKIPLESLITRLLELESRIGAPNELAKEIATPRPQQKTPSTPPQPKAEPIKTAPIAEEPAMSLPEPQPAKVAPLSPKAEEPPVVKTEAAPQPEITPAPVATLVAPPVDIEAELKKRNIHETIIRFASVELNGSVKKNS